jgi:hypothetical protein
VIAVIHASLRGKIPRLENYEDILTSNVFSALRYCTNSDLLVRIMQQAIDPDGNPIPLDCEGLETVSYFFWPYLKESEPDVLIALERVSGKVDLVCVEVKYRHGKSGEDSHNEVTELSEAAVRDQLARQYRDLDALRRGVQRIEGVRQIHNTYLVYLTLDAAMPIMALEATLRSMPPGGQVYWLSWRVFPDAVERWCPHNEMDRLIRSDLITYLHHKALRTDVDFALEQLENLSWSYASKERAVARPLWELKSISRLAVKYDQKGGDLSDKYFSECQAVHFKCAQYRG